MYRLQAVIAAEHLLRDLASAVGDARIVALGQHLSLLPMTDALFDAVTVAGAQRLGVTKGDHQDEFDAVDLGRHRDAEGWLASTN